MLKTEFDKIGKYFSNILVCLCYLKLGTIYLVDLLSLKADMNSDIALEMADKFFCSIALSQTGHWLEFSYG